MPYPQSYCLTFIFYQNRLHSSIFQIKQILLQLNKQFLFSKNKMFHYTSYPNYFSYYPQIYMQPSMMFPNYSYVSDTTILHQTQNNQIFSNENKIQKSDTNSSKLQTFESELSYKQSLNLTKEDLQKYVNPINRKLWTQQEDQLLKKVAIEKQLNWKAIAQYFPHRNANQCYGRYRRVIGQSKRRGWTKKQDQTLIACVQEYGQSWKTFINHFQNRTSKQIRERYLNNLRPNILNEQWTVQQDLVICDMVNKYGKKWKLFEEFLQGRTQNRIKNRYYGHIKKIYLIKQKHMKYKYIKKSKKLIHKIEN